MTLLLTKSVYQAFIAKTHKVVIAACDLCNDIILHNLDRFLQFALARQNADRSTGILSAKCNARISKALCNRHVFQHCNNHTILKQSHVKNTHGDNMFRPAAWITHRQMAETFNTLAIYKNDTALYCDVCLAVVVIYLDNRVIYVHKNDKKNCKMKNEFVTR